MVFTIQGYVSSSMHIILECLCPLETFSQQGICLSQSVKVTISVRTLVVEFTYS